MAETRRRHAGGIRRLDNLIREHGDELEADLLDKQLRLRDCPSKGFSWRDLKIFVKFVGVQSNLYRALFPEAADWDLQSQLLATLIDFHRRDQWLRAGGSDSGYPPPDPIQRPGVAKRKGDHRRGNAPRSETNKVLGMRLDDRTDPDREAKVRAMFRGSSRGPVRDLRQVK